MAISSLKGRMDKTSNFSFQRQEAKVCPEQNRTTDQVYPSKSHLLIGNELQDCRE